MGFVALALSAPSDAAWAATAPSLGSAGTFGVVSSTFTNNNAATVVNGDVCFTTGPFTSFTLNGTQTVPCASQVGQDQNTALADLNGQSCVSLGAGVVQLDTVVVGANLPGTIPPGCYFSGGSMNINTLATVTLSGVGVYIFRPGGALGTGADSNVSLTNGATASNVFWTPAAATTIGANATFKGNIIDAAGITLGHLASLTGRALAFGGTVTADANTITVEAGQAAPVPVCTLSASPSAISPGMFSTLSASCSPAATSYAWGNTGFASTVASGAVSPTVTTTYSVVGTNAAGSSAAAGATVTVNALSGSVAQALIVHASTSQSKTTIVRFVNPTGSAGALSATAFDENGNLVGNANANLGNIGANQSMTLNSADLEQLIGFAPSAPTSKYSVYFYATLPAFQVVNYSRANANGARTLSQSQYKDRTSVAIASNLTRSAWFMNSSTSANKTSVLRLINTSSESSPLSASLYDENGALFAGGNTYLGIIAARKMLSYTSAQLENAMGYTPLSPTAKYRVVFSANLPSLELINFTKDNALGNLALVQAQQDDRPSSQATTSSRNVPLVNASTNTERTTVLRMVNPSPSSATLTATAYDEAGNLVGSGALADATPYQTVTMTSAQIEAAMHYTPSSADAKYRLVVNASVPSFEVIDSTKIISSGDLHLAQPQTDNRATGVATTTERNAYVIYPTASTNSATELRLTNTTGAGAALTATAYDDNGALIGMNVPMGTLGANQMMTFSAQQLQTLFGYTPLNGNSKWRISFSANLANFELANYTRESAAAPWVLAQPQTE